MEIARYIVMGIYAVVCLVLTYLTFKQTKEEGSSVITGAAGNNFYEKNKGNQYFSCSADDFKHNCKLLGVRGILSS